MNRYVASRWVMKKHLIFPGEVFVEKYHIRTRKRRFPLFWIFYEESIPLSKIASIKLHKGLLFSDIVIENSGGDFPIRMEGFTNAVAQRLKKDLESRERNLAGQAKQVQRVKLPEDTIEIDDGFSWNEEYEVTVHGME